MQNIDPVLFLEPALSLAMVLGTLIFWWDRKGFRGNALLLGAAAYWAAILVKSAVGIFGAGLLSALQGQSAVGYALTLGSETVFLEVGLAYALSVYGARKRRLGASEAVPFGISLAFWENGVLLGLLSIFNLGVVYLLLGSGSALAQTVYSQLLASSPAYFAPPTVLLPSVLLGTLERVSSALAHVAWGMLCVLSAVTGRKRYLAYALPMGLLDSLVPFAPGHIYIFEGAIFALSLLFLLVAALSLSAEKKRTPPATPQVAEGPA